MLILGWLSCTSLRGESEFAKAQQAESPQEAEQHYASGCGYGHIASCEAWLRVLSGRKAPEIERIEALRVLCEASPEELGVCTELGALLLRSGDMEHARAVLERACDGGEAAACGHLGVALAEADVVRARALLQIAVRNHPRFKPTLAELTEDAETAYRLRLEACEANVLDGCVALPIGADRAWEEATLQDCLFGEMRACQRIGALYGSIEGTPWSPEQFYWKNREVCPADTDACREAEDTWFAQVAERLEGACDSADAEACEAYGRLVETGRGVEPNLGRAALLFRSSCEGGAREGCWRYGHALQEGRGVARDRVEAVRWFDRSCDAGSAMGCDLAALARYNGHGIARDLAAARRFAQRACTSGRCLLYAAMLGAGHGGPEDPEAQQWALRAGCNAGEADSCRRLWADGDKTPGTVVRTLSSDGIRAMQLALVGCADWDASACRVLGLMTTKETGHPRLDAPETSRMAAERAASLGYAFGFQMTGDLERACEMGMRWVCEDLASQGIRVRLPGVRP